MTCEEFRFMILSNPLTRTVAERIACCKHHGQCRGCQEHLEGLYQRSKAQVGDDVVTLIEAVSAPVMLNRLLQDLADPEVR